VFYEHARLRVLGPPPGCVFLMKLYAAREPEYDDLVALWPRCNFTSLSDAADRFTVAYPHAPELRVSCNPAVGLVIARQTGFNRRAQDQALSQQTACAQDRGVRVSIT